MSLKRPCLPMPLKSASHMGRKRVMLQTAMVAGGHTAGKKHQAGKGECLCPVPCLPTGVFHAHHQYVGRTGGVEAHAFSHAKPRREGRKEVERYKGRIGEEGAFF